MGAKQDKVLPAWFTDGRGKPSQLSLAPEVGVACYLWGSVNRHHSAEEGTVTEQYPLLLSLPWELTHPATATAKCSGNHLNLPKAC